MKASLLIVLFLGLISGCASTQSSSSDQNTTNNVIATWQDCVPYSHDYASTVDSLDGSSKANIVHQIVLGDLKKLQASYGDEDIEAKRALTFSIRAMEDAAYNIVKPTVDASIKDNAYTYCMAEYGQVDKNKDYMYDFLINADAGKFSKFPMEWQSSGTECMAFTIIQPHFGTRWLPKVAITYRLKDDADSDTQWAQISLTAENDQSLLTLKYRYVDSDGDTVYAPLLEDIPYNSSVKFKITYPTPDSLLIEVGENSSQRSLNFIPTQLDFLASSSESVIEVLPEHRCY